MQEGDNFDVVPKTQLVISRTAYKNNTSKYFINDRASTYSEVTDLLKGRGIDLDNNRFLILQVSAFHKYFIYISTFGVLLNNNIGRSRTNCYDETQSTNTTRGRVVGIS